MAESLASWWSGRGLLPGKLTPPRLGPDRLVRPRVREALAALAHHRVVLVNGPAGIGKTTAVAQWLDDEPAVAWLAPSTTEDEPVRLTRYLLGALAGPGWIDEPPAWPFEDEAFDMPAWLTEHVVLPLALDGPPITLVIDDIHALTSAPTWEGLAFLVHNLPPRLRMVLAGRQPPPVPLARLEAEGVLGRLGADTLWMTAEESDAFLRAQLGPSSTPPQRARLHERTGGWPAALQLLTLTPPSTPKAAPAVASREFTAPTSEPNSSAPPPHEPARSSIEPFERRALDFLAQEVIDRLPPPDRRFLLDTAVLDRLDPPLCDAVTGRNDAALMLEKLTDAGLVIATRSDFRCAPLLRDALRRQLESTPHSPLHTLHRRAARYFDRQGLLDEAIAHAEAAGDHEQLADLAAEHGLNLLRARRMGLLGRLLDGIDEPRRRRSPLLSTLEAWAGLRHSPQAAQEALGRARTALSSGDPGPARNALRASQAVLEAFIALRRGQAPATLDALLADDSTIPAGLAVALGMAAGLAAERRGDPSSALTHLERARRLGLAHTPPLPSGCSALAHYARVLRRAGRRDEAARAVDQGHAALERNGWSALPVAAELSLEHAMLELDDGHPARAEARTVAALRTLRLGGEPSTVARGLLGLAMIRRARGELDDARDAAAQCEALARDAGIIPLVNAARQLLAPPETQRPAPAPSVETAHPSDPSIATTRSSEPRARPSSDPPSTPNVLSPREKEVLQLVAQGLSNQIVGRRLFISPVTVKTHVHNILTKLGAHNRTEAVHRARTLGWLA